MIFFILLFLYEVNSVNAYDNWHFYAQSGNGLIDTQTWEYYMGIGDSYYLNMDSNELYFGIGNGSVNYTNGDTYISGTPDGSVNFTSGGLHFTPQY